MSYPPNPSAPKRLERSRSNRFLGGVCGGTARYLNMDPTVVRVLWAVLTVVLGGAPLIAYLVMLFVVPEEGSVPPPVTGPNHEPPAMHQPPVMQQPEGQQFPDQQSPDQQVWGEAGAPWEQAQPGDPDHNAPSRGDQPVS